jgi:hypothetical protein
MAETLAYDLDGNACLGTQARVSIAKVSKRARLGGMRLATSIAAALLVVLYRDSAEKAQTARSGFLRLLFQTLLKTRCMQGLSSGRRLYVTNLGVW